MWEGKDSTTAADIYALGCVLFEMLTGEKAFKGETPPAVMMAHFQPPTLPNRWPDGVPAGVTTVLQQALARNPAERFETAGKMSAALNHLTAPPEPRVTVDPAQSPQPPAAGIDSPHGTTSEPSDFAAAPLPDDSAIFSDSPADEGDNTSWRSFLAHLGPYVMVVGVLGIINALTSSYPWFLWVAFAWGIGLLFHLRNVLLANVIKMEGKWGNFAQHISAYAIIIGILGLMNVLTGGYPWFIWPALGWGIGLGIHFWNTLIAAESKDDTTSTARWSGDWSGNWTGWRRQRIEQKVARRARRRSSATVQPAAAPVETDDSLKRQLKKAHAYKTQIDKLVAAHSNEYFQPHLRDLAAQVNQWTTAIESLAQRIEKFRRNTLIQHDLQTVPQAIDKLEQQLAAESDPATHAELERALANRRRQLNTLQGLQATINRAEIKIENTLSQLGTIYPQILTSQSIDPVSDYSRITSAVSEEVKVLRDHLEAMEEVKFGAANSG